LQCPRISLPHVVHQFYSSIHLPQNVSAFKQCGYVHHHPGTCCDWSQMLSIIWGMNSSSAAT
jgi:hypothetical protein